jgi:hypothetical protein
MSWETWTNLDVSDDAICWESPLTPNPSLLRINDQECDKILSIQRV